jgi:hypothetical protein
MASAATSDDQPRAAVWKRSGRGGSNSERALPAGGSDDRGVASESAALVARDRERILVGAVDSAAAREGGAIGLPPALNTSLTV